MIKGFDKGYIKANGKISYLDWSLYDLNHPDAENAVELKRIDGVIDQGGNFLAFTNMKLGGGHDGLRACRELNKLSFIEGHIENAVRVSSYRSEIVFDREFYNVKGYRRDGYFSFYNVPDMQFTEKQVRAMFQFLHIRGYKYADEMTPDDPIEKHVLYGFFKSYYNDFFQPENINFTFSDFNLLSNKEFGSYLKKHIKQTYEVYKKSFLDILSLMPPEKIEAVKFLLYIRTIKDNSIITPQNFKEVHRRNIQRQYAWKAKEEKEEQKESVQKTISFYKEHMQLLPQHKEMIKKDLFECLSYLHNGFYTDGVPWEKNFLDRLHYHNIISGDKDHEVQHFSKEKEELKNCAMKDKPNFVKQKAIKRIEEVTFVSDDDEWNSAEGTESSEKRPPTEDDDKYPF